MKTITEQLFEAADGLITLQPEVSDNTGNYHMADDGGVETETGEFLYGLVRLLQPGFILETGTYTGVSAMYMGNALKDNGHGLMWTLEVENKHKERAEKLWEKVGLSTPANHYNWVTCRLEASLDLEPKMYHLNSLEWRDLEIDLLFLDSEPEFRFKELVKFYPYVKPGGFIFIHDLHRHLSQHDNEKFFGWPYGKLLEEIVNLIKEDKLRVISFPTPRGLTGFYKPREDDYRV